MVIILSATPTTYSQEDMEALVTKVFLKSIDLIGWLKQLAEYRTLTWLPSVARAAFVIVLKEEYLKSELEIAEYVGLTRNTVRNILRADPDLAIYKLKHLEELTAEQKKELKVHIAWWIAKIAYKMIKEWQEPNISKYFVQDSCKALDIPWAYLLLKKIRGVHFPIMEVDVLKDKVKDIKVEWKELINFIDKIEYPVVSPADLLHKIKQIIKMNSEYF